MKITTYLKFMLLASISSLAISHAHSTSKSSWYTDEITQRKAIIQAFWDQRIIKNYPDSIINFKKAIIDFHFPNNLEWNEKIEKLFTNAINLRINYESFYAGLNEVPISLLRGMNAAEKLVVIPED